MSLIWLGLLSAAPAASASTLQYYGGPVAHSMNVYLVEWGSGVRTTYTDPSTGDPGLFSYLASQSGATTDIGGVLAQYMDNSGANSQNRVTYGGMTKITPPTSGGVRGCSLPSCVDDSVIQTELQDDINAKSLPAPTGNGLQTMYVILFPTGTNVCEGGSCAYDNNGFCAYHSSFTLTGSTHVLYAPMPDNGPGTPNAGACGPNTTSDVANQTDVLSHEFAETVNDPLTAENSTAWGDTNGNEIADVCVNSTEQAPNGSFTVQKLWSNLDNNCVAGESAYGAPTAAFLASSTATAARPLGFDASGSTDPSADTTAISGTSYSIPSGLASYAWDWGDGTRASSSSASITHTYATAGNYEVSLTVTDNLGFTSTVTHQVSVSTPPPPIVTTGPASGITSHGATVTGTINPEDESVQYEFIYGTSPSALTHATPLAPGPTGHTAIQVSATLAALSPSTAYYYELEAVSGNQTYTDNPPSPQTFTTSAPPPVQTPSASTGSATQISPTTAELSGAVNPEGSAPVTYWFIYGTSPTNLDQTTPQAGEPGGSTPVPVSAPISGLSPGTVYYYALQVSLNGNSSSGSVAHFTTLTPAPGGTPLPPPALGASASPTPAPVITTGAPSHITSSGAAVSGTVNPNGVSTTYQVQFGTSSSYGYSSPPLAAGSGTSRLPVSVTLNGLKPRTTYHYRFVASSPYTTVVGADATVTTTRELAPPPRFSFRVLSAPALSLALSGGLEVRFTCSKACRAEFSVLLVPNSSALRTGGTPLVVGLGSRRLRAKGSATAILGFTRRGRNRLRSANVLNLSISGLAVGNGTAPSPPVLRKITLRRRS